jgi:hypothetical protein
MTEPIFQKERAEEATPPFGKSWGRWYASVLGWLALLIVLFALFTFIYNR